MKTLVGVVLATWVSAVGSLPAFAQVYTGRIDVTLVDSTGAVLPGATVEISGVQSASAGTDARGEVHFLNLAPGRYTVVAKLQGFADYKNTNVPVTAGGIVTLPVTLLVGAVSAQTTVNAVVPVLDTKSTAVATHVTADELQSIPSARDPWVVLQTVPGVVVDRVNVGGTESGQQSEYIAKGASLNDNTWNLDGISITDVAANGGSPTYYDFDMFQEIQFTTGGADPATPTPGVQLNFVLRSGTNQWKGQGRYYFANHTVQGENVSRQLFGTLQAYNRVNQLTDYGGQLGGPIVKDRLWVWGAYGRTEPRNEIFGFQTVPATLPLRTGDCRATGTSFVSTAQQYAITARDCTTLENYSAKLTSALDTNTRATFEYFRGNKVKSGRSAGATRPDETTWNQTGPTSVYKAELDRTLGSSLFAKVLYAHTASGFSLIPNGGTNVAYQDPNGVWHGNYLKFITNRPQDNVTGEGNLFSGSNELKFGFGWKRAVVTSDSTWPGGEYNINGAGAADTAVLVRDAVVAGHAIYMDGYFGDTLTRDRLTVNLGVRWDRQAGSIDAASVAANALDPVNLPAITQPAKPNAIVWDLVTPRAGISYALTSSHKTVARLSYAMYASQLQSNTAPRDAGAIPAYSYAYYSVKDTNGNHIADKSEIAAGTFLGTSFSGGGTAGKYTTPRSHEIVAAIDHEVMANMGLSVTYSWRRFTNFDWVHAQGITAANFMKTGDLTCTSATTCAPVGPYDVPIYALSVPLPASQIYEAQHGYHQRYHGVEVALTKRMANRWMMRVNGSWNDHREYFNGTAGIQDPTPTINPQQATINLNKNGGEVIVESAGSGKSNVFLTLPKYQFTWIADYEAMWGIDLAVNYAFRQGFAEPFYLLAVPGTADALSPGGKNIVVVSDVNALRLPNVHSFDCRVSKAFKFSGGSEAHLDLDVFNPFNFATVLQRQFAGAPTSTIAAGSTFNAPLEIMNPRLIRFGFRIGF
jgi:hypothetical protein